MKTQGIIGSQHDGYIEGQQISGDTAAAPEFPIDIILSRPNCFAFQVKSADSYTGTRIVYDLIVHISKLHS
jgi:hypothetical protein